MKMIKCIDSLDVDAQPIFRVCSSAKGRINSLAGLAEIDVKCARQWSGSRSNSASSY